MTEKVKSYQAAARRLMEALHVTHPPMAIKLAKDESEIPENAIRPLRDLGLHYAECQCLAMSRKDKKTYVFRTC